MTVDRNISHRSKIAVLDPRAKKGFGQLSFMLFFGLFLLAGAYLAIGMAGATGGDGAAAPDPVAAPSEVSGHDLYRRGFYEEAIAEWTRAVEEKGDTGAAFRLGEEYFDAKVVTRDIESALKYLRMGAEGGDSRAQQDLATMFDNGWGVTKDVDEAAKWYLAAALQGNAVAQYNIGTMYETGAGVEQDIEQAYMYYLLAVEGGFPHFATTELENVSLQMTAQQIKDATVKARQFKPVGRDIEDQDG